MQPLNTIASKLKIKDDRKFRITLLLCAIVLIIYREPALLLHPRLWAEEGCVFYEYARHHTVWDIFTTAHVGYLTLFNSLVSALQAKIFSVEAAATVSTYFGFLVQLVPIYIISFTTHKFWDNSIKKIACVFIVIIVTAPELWLNTTNSHFIFGLITFLIMLVPASTISGLQKYSFRLLLFIAGLTGPASVFFTPAFLIKAYREKTREKYIQAGIITMCALIQAMVIVYAILYNNTYKRLSVHNYKRTIYHFFVDNFSMLPHTSTSYLNITMFGLGLFYGVLMAAFCIYLLLKNRKDTDYLISLSSIFIVGTFSTLGSLNMGGSPRYAYIPTCIFLIVITSETFKANRSHTMLKYISPLVLFLCFSTNILYYKYGMRNVYAPTYPVWASEVARWRANNSYAPRIHPGTDVGQCIKL